jgi:hypothetical protein
MSSAIERRPVGPCGWPKTRLQPKVFMSSGLTPVSRANHRSLTAKGLCVVIAATSSIDLPADSSARSAAGTGACGIRLLATRANPVPRIRTTPSPEISRASAAVVTTAPAAPSAGWVCEAKVCSASGAAGGKLPMPSRVLGRTPSSASRVRLPLRCGISTGTW